MHSGSAPASLARAGPGTVGELLADAAKVPGTGVRILDRQERASWHPWSDVAVSAARVGGGLRALGVSRGQRVALVYPTCRSFLDAFLGILAAGAVPVPLYPPVRLGRADEYHRRTAAALAAVDAALVLADPRVRRILGSATEAAAPPLGCRTLDELPAAATTDLEPPGPDDLALVQLSSGTTVDPKPVALTHRAVLAQTRILNGFWPDRDGIVNSGVSWLPLYHDMGLIGCVFPALERPAVLTLLPPEAFVARPALWLRAISRYRGTISVAPNFAYALATERVRDEELAGVDLSSWRVALDGAETVSPATLRAFAERFAPYGFRASSLTPVYGLSEAALALTFGALDAPFRSLRVDRERLAAGEAVADPDRGRELVSVGRPLPGFEIELRDDDGALLGEGRVGRIRARGPSLMREYLGRPEATRAVLSAAGWLDTGDLGFVLDGDLFLVGRAKDTLLVRGRNHPPEEIEQAVSQLPGARPGCAVAVGHLAEGGETERVLLFVEHHRRASESERSALPELSRETALARTGLAVDEVLVLAPGTLPRTSSGKLRRAETLRRHLAGELLPPRRVTAALLASELLRSGLAHRRAARARPADEPED